MTISKRKKQCDILFSKIIRLRDKHCLKCGTTQNLQCAHLSSRKNLGGRWDEDNAITLCLKHHLFWAHKEPLAFAYWVQSQFPDKYERALTISSSISKYIDYEGLYKDLKQRLRELETGEVNPYYHEENVANENTELWKK